MKPQDIDAFVSIVREAIDTREKQLRADAEQMQAKLLGQIEALKSELASLRQAPLPDPVGPSPEQVAGAVDAFMKANPVPVPAAPEPLEPTIEHIAAAVEAYSKANPVPVPVAPEPIAPSAEQIAAAVADYVKANPVPVPAAPEPLEPTPEQISAAVAKHMDSHPVEIPAEALEGMVSDYMKANPVPAIEPSEALIAQSVQKHLQANPPKAGDRGLDALEINVLPRIDPDRSYAKGTYASHAGGVLRAACDTQPGPNPLEQGWYVVIEGIAKAEVHQLEPGVVAVKTVLTGGASQIEKIELPTMQYKGVWRVSEGEYSKGNTVTHQGSIWHANRPTTDRPGTSDAWSLAVKRGADGKDVNAPKPSRPGVVTLEGK